MHLRLPSSMPRQHQPGLLVLALAIFHASAQTTPGSNRTAGASNTTVRIQGGARGGVPGGHPDIVPGVEEVRDAEDPSPEVAQMLDSMKRTVTQCAITRDLLKCLKIRALKTARRVAKSKELELIAGVDVVQVKNLTTRQSRALDRTDALSEDQLQALENESINGMLLDVASNFVQTHVVNIDLPRLIDVVQGRGSGGGVLGGFGGGFGGGKRKKNRYAAPFLAALAIKGVIMSMTYKGIAVMAGTALIIGKIALILAAILGLKKLVSGEKERTTVEIVKHPVHSSSHSHSSSFEDSEDHYRRSIPTEEEMMILDNINRDSYLN